MQFKKYTNVHQFYNDTFNVLMRDEAQNLIPLGNLIIGHAGEDKTGWRDPANWFMATVSDGSSIQMTAIMTPPHNIALYATDNNINLDAINCLVKGLADYPIPGVLTEKELAKRFSQAYTSKKGLTYEVAMDQRIYELTEVNPEIPQFGTLRLVEEKDMPFFPFWLEDFFSTAKKGYNSTTLNSPQNEEHYHYWISRKDIYILENDGHPVSMAGFSREMQTVVGVGRVYTPPYYRGKGYASSCVAQLSQLALDKGFTKCVLYTDLANPTSNSIYRKIGYNPICDSLMLKFV